MVEDVLDSIDMLLYEPENHDLLILLKEGMVIAIEPMATLGDWRVVLQDDEWTFKTKDGSLAAHFEHTMVVTKDGAEVLTKI